MFAFLLVAALALFLRGERREEPAPRGAPACTCELERARAGWCEACAVGHVGGREIRSRLLYDALDAHGHDVRIDALPCATCRRAAAEDGFCEGCGRGFVGGRAYLSPLAYRLARDEPERAAPELAVLDLALDELARCELCASAMVIDGTCPKCLIAWSGGTGRPLRGAGDGLRDASPPSAGAGPGDRRRPRRPRAGDRRASGASESARRRPIRSGRRSSSAS